ncbi:MAG: flagellar biosynthesis repressor FlbT [Pseudomonadota bacterium]
MSGLILKLRPFEKLLINGVVIENGERKAKLRVCTEGARVLRLRDAMRPEDATTPATRAYHAAQMGVSGELTPAQAHLLIEQSLAPDRAAIPAETLATIEDACVKDDFYKAMRHIRTLIEREREAAAAVDGRRTAAAS